MTTIRLDSADWYTALSQGAPVSVLGIASDHVLARSGMSHRIVWGPSQDAVDGGYTVYEDGEEVEDRYRALGLEEAAIEAIGTARAQGGAWLWPVTTDGDMSQPLGPGPHPVSAVHVLTRRDVQVLTWETDMRSPMWGRPLTVMVTPIRDGMSWPGRVFHTSRLCYVPGSRATPDQRTGGDGYDIPTLALYATAVDGMEGAWDGLSRLIKNRAYPWLRLALGRNVATTEYASTIATRLQAIAAGIARQALMVIGEGDEVGWSAPSLGGTMESIAALALRATVVEGYPVTELLGQAPGGLSTDDAAGRRAYGRLLGRCRAAVEPALLEVYAIMRGPSDSRRIEWEPMERPTAQEMAATSLTLAQRDATLVASGIISADEARSRYGGVEEAHLPELATSEDFGEPEAPMPAPLAIAGPAAESKDAEPLNGAQITAAQGIMHSVATGQTSRESGRLLLEGVVSPARAAALIASIKELPPETPPPGGPTDG